MPLKKEPKQEKERLVTKVKTWGIIQRVSRNVLSVANCLGIYVIYSDDARRLMPVLLIGNMPCEI